MESQEVFDADAVRATSSTPIPETLLNGLSRYFNERIPTGGFLRAVLENNLVQAVVGADPDSVRVLIPLVRILMARAPALAWGSELKVRRWLAGRAEMLDKAAG